MGEGEREWQERGETRRQGEGKGDSVNAVELNPNPDVAAETEQEENTESSVGQFTNSGGPWLLCRAERELRRLTVRERRRPARRS